MSTTQPCLWTEGFGAVGTVLGALEANGVTLAHLARLRTDPDLARRASEVILAGALDEPASHDKLRRLFQKGGGFFGIREWQQLCQASFTPEEINEVTKFPWSTRTLNSQDPWDPSQSIAETHFAFLGIPTVRKRSGNRIKLDMVGFETLDFFHADNRDHKFSFDFKPDWVMRLPSTHSTCALRWYLIRLGSAGSEGAYIWQEASLRDHPEYEVPSAVELVSARVLRLGGKTKDEDHRYVPFGVSYTSDENPGHGRICVGNISVQPGSLVITTSKQSNHFTVGISPSRKIPVR